MTKLLFDMGVTACEAAAVVLAASAASRSTQFVQDHREQNLWAFTVGDGVRVGRSAEERILTVGWELDEGGGCVGLLWLCRFSLGLYGGRGP
jgi:hypothetical protein